MTGALPRALALIEADVLAGRRALGEGRLGRTTSGAAHAGLGAFSVALGVGAGAAAAEWLRSGAAGAAAGVVDVFLAMLLAAAVIAPLLGTAAARVRTLARHCTAPTDGSVLLLAATAREAVGAPLGPALCLALGAAVGHTLAAGPLAVLHALLVTLALASFGVGVGSWLAAWAESRPRAGVVRFVVAASVVTLVAVLAGGGFATPDGDVAGWFASAHGTRARAVLSPSNWAATAIVDGGAAAWWVPLALVALACWAIVGAMRGATLSTPEARAALSRAGSKWWARLDGPFGALVAKDLILLRRDPGVRAAALRHASLAALPALVVLCAAAGAAGDPVLAARTARWVPQLGLLSHLLTVALTGVVVLLPRLDRGGVRQTATLPLSPRTVLLARALAWTMTAVPAVALVAGALVLATVGLVGVGGAVAVGPANLSAMYFAALPALLFTVLEAGSSVAAGAGAGLLAAALTASLRGSRDERSDPGSGSSGSVLGGLFAAFITLSAVSAVAVAFHGVGGLPGTLVGVLVGPLVGGLATLAAAAVEQARRERGAVVC